MAPFGLFLKENKKVPWLLKFTAKKRKILSENFLAGPLPIRPPANPNVVPLNGQVRKLYRKLFICSGRELITEPSDLPNPLEWTTMTTAGWAAASASVAAVGDLGSLGDGHPLSETGNILRVWND